MREAGLSSSSDSPDSSSSSESRVFARRVLQFLGKLGSNLTSSLAAVESKHVFAWDVVNQVRWVEMGLCHECQFIYCISAICYFGDVRSIEAIFLHIFVHDRIVNSDY